MEACNKIKTVVLNAALVAGLTLCMHAQADLLDTLKSATDVIKKTGVLDRASSSPETPSQPVLSGTSKSVAHVEDLPLGLVEYPRSKLQNQINNPFDQVLIPISPPKRITSDKWVPRYSVPVEGKVTMLYFEHEVDDSPLLIQKHYESWMASNGFERLLVCKAPCAEANYIYWYPYLDPAKLQPYHLYPNDATYIAGYKESGMVIVSVGMLGNHHYGSFVKVVEGQVTDNSAWKKLTTPATLPPPVEPSQPAASTPGMSGVQAISAENALKYVREAKGVTFVQVSSYDRNCGYCITGNAGYENFSKRYAGKAVYLQITAQPWADALKSEFAHIYGISSVPTTLVFKDGQLKRQYVGTATADELDQKLVK